MRGSRGKENIQKTFLKARKKFSAFRQPCIFFIFQTCFQYYLTVFAVFTSCMLHSEVSRQKTGKKTAKYEPLPGREIFCWPHWTRNSTRRVISILLQGKHQNLLLWWSWCYAGCGEHNLKHFLDRFLDNYTSFDNHADINRVYIVVPDDKENSTNNTCTDDGRKIKEGTSKKPHSPATAHLKSTLIV